MHDAGHNIVFVPGCAGNSGPSTSVGDSDFFGSVYTVVPMIFDRVVQPSAQAI